MSLGNRVVHVIVRMDGSAMDKTDIHSIWPSVADAMNARERIYSGDDDRPDGAGYLYEVVPVVFGELLDPVILRQRVENPQGF